MNIQLQNPEPEKDIYYFSSQEERDEFLRDLYGYISRIDEFMERIEHMKKRIRSLPKQEGGR